jgi:hypothetical protein
VGRAWGGFIGTARCTGGRGPASARGVHWGARCANGREPEVSATVEHMCPLPLPMFKRWLGANLCEFEQDRCEGFVHLTMLCLLCMDVARF